MLLIEKIRKISCKIFTYGKQAIALRFIIINKADIQDHLSLDSEAST